MEKHLDSVSIFSVALMVALFSLFVPMRAAADDDDPPGRVARLGYIRGSVSFQPAGTDEWVNAIVNRPITTGDKLWADHGSRAELQVGSASIRMAGNTGFSFLNLTDNTMQIQLTAGTLRVRVKRLDENETFEIDTPNLAFSVERPGVYRINVRESGDGTVIKVRDGEGEVTGAGSSYTIHAREVGTFSGTDQLIADFSNYQTNYNDDFEAWAANRDRHEDFSVSARYVSPDVVGYEDLDDYGEWRPVAEYGTVWFPHTTIVGWAPYRYGHWAYVYPWGYTWIDDAPWGFAPFHYGRWVNVGGVWGWVPCPPRAPGVIYVRPVYAPALVAWVGGPHFGVGVGVGWFPLAPREVYVPSYPVSRAYVNNVNVSNTTVSRTVINNYYNTTVVNRNTTVVNNNVTVIHQTYVNQSVPGAVTATTQQAFTSAQPVAKNVVMVNQKEVASAPVNAFTPPVAPAKQAVLGGGPTVAVKPPAEVQSRVVVAKATPPPPPVTFSKQQQAIEANGGKPLAIAQMRQIQPATTQVVHPNVKIAPPAKPATPQNVQGGKRGQPLNSGSNEPGPTQTNSGYKPFTTSNAGQPSSSSGNNGTVNGGSKTLNDRPPSVRPNAGKEGKDVGNNDNPSNVGQPSNPPRDNGSANANSKTLNDRPASARPNGAGKDNGNPTNVGQPGKPPRDNGGANANSKTLNDRPPSARPNDAGKNSSSRSNNANDVASGLDQKHQQQLEQLHAKQDQDRQQVQQQQERQKLVQKNAGDPRLQQLDQKHQQQLQTPEKKHDSEQQKPQQKQEDEKRKKTPPERDDHSSHDRS